MSELIQILKTNEIYLSSQPILPFCQACYDGPKPIRSIQENQQFLGDILPTIQKQLDQAEFLTVQLVGQDQPSSWQSVREVWIDPIYQGGCFLCRFCVPLRTHPNYRKFYLFDNQFFYLDQKWKKAAEKHYQWEQEYKRRVPDD